MTHGTLQLDSLNEHNLQVMQAYANQAAAAKAVAKAAGEQESDDGGFDGWLERLNSLTGFTAEQLTQLHGQLIALGFLKFEISGRSIGLKYQISPRGKQAMERAEAIAAGRSDEEADSAGEDECGEDVAATSSLNPASEDVQPAEEFADAA
jgi:hypothetical protein